VVRLGLTLLIPFLGYLVFGLAGGPESRRHVQAAQGQEEVAQRARQVLFERAEELARQDRLVADFYRIYRKLAYPLPVTSINPHDIQVEGLKQYPWEIWMIWELEERIHSLAWSGEWSGNQGHRNLAERDLAALTLWPTYNLWDNPHLSVGHTGRLMAVALKEWSWLSDEVRSALSGACFRLVSMHAPWFKESRARLQNVQDILSHTERGSLIHNIPVIATLGMAMAARASQHPLQDELDGHLRALILAELELRTEGVTEAISYDGYILDFVVDWLSDVAEELRGEILQHPEFSRMMRQAVLLATPGRLETFAPINDVEALEMPYHAGILAKTMEEVADPVLAWFLKRYPIELLPADALAALASSDQWPREEAPKGGAYPGLYVYILRSGWSADDVAVVISASESPSGHIQRDNGTLVIGTEKMWLIDDPGYQQYLPGEEREFTIGPTAHNAPVINGVAQSNRSLGDVSCRQLEPGVLRSTLDLTPAYPDQLGLERVIRDVWLVEDEYVVVADQVRGKSSLQSVQYNWHAHPEAAVWVDQSGRGLIDAAPAQLWLQCAGRRLSGVDLKRLPGSRGQMTFQLTTPIEGEGVFWWIFSLGKPVEYRLSPTQDSLLVGSRSFSIG